MPNLRQMDLLKEKYLNEDKNNVKLFIDKKLIKKS